MNQNFSFSGNRQSSNTFQKQMNHSKDDKILDLQREVERRGILVRDLIRQLEILTNKDSPVLENEKLIAQLEGQNLGLFFKIQEQHIENQNIKNNLSIARKKTVAEKEENEKAKAQLETLKHEKNLWQTKSFHDEEKFAAEIHALEKKNAEFELEKQLLEEENQNIQQQIIDEQEKHKILLTEYQQLEQAHQNLEQKFDHLHLQTEENSLWENKYHSLKETVSALEQEIEQSQTKFQKTKQELDDLQLHQKELMIELQDRAQNEQTLIQEKQSLQKKLRQISSQSNQDQAFLEQTKQKLLQLIESAS